ncbi:hypothetical protein H4219_002292 [Mycoemilia scoparia]|uniref:F-box domain-containing protein n=1 Tax=Mycoemilia scoparia TaxID=417184 RepID=A0A9W8A7A8_9FUNG|nr:hypothetical protein H4219_002292 [Mycoemilia scoparia]
MIRRYFSSNQQSPLHSLFAGSDLETMTEPSSLQPDILELMPSEAKDQACEYYFRQQNNKALAALSQQSPEWNTIAMKYISSSHMLCDNAYRDPLSDIGPRTLADTRHLSIDLALTDLHTYGGKMPDYDLFRRTMSLDWQALDSLTVLPVRQRFIRRSSLASDSCSGSSANGDNSRNNSDSESLYAIERASGYSCSKGGGGGGGSSSSSNGSGGGDLARLLTPQHQIPTSEFPTVTKLLMQIPSRIGERLLYLRLGLIQNIHVRIITTTCPNLLGFVTESFDMVDTQLDVNGLMALGHELVHLRSLSVHTNPPGAELHYINRKFLRLYRDRCWKDDLCSASMPSSSNLQQQQKSLIISQSLRSLAIKHWFLSQTSIHMLLSFFPSLTYLHINPAIFQRQTINAELRPYPSLRVLRIESVNQKKLQAVHRLLGIFANLKVCVFNSVDVKPQAVDALIRNFPNIKFDFNQHPHSLTSFS